MYTVVYWEKLNLTAHGKEETSCLRGQVIDIQKLNGPGKEEASYLRGQEADIQNESSTGIRKMIAA